MWRAIRYGHGRQADRPRAPRSRSTRAGGGRAAAGLDGADARRARRSTPCCPTLNGAQRQRRADRRRCADARRSSRPSVQRDPRDVRARRSAPHERANASSPRARPRRSCAPPTRRSSRSSSRCASRTSLVQTIVTLVNLGAPPGRPGRPGTEAERDLEQVRLGDRGRAGAAAALSRPSSAPSGAAIRDALSQLQMAYAQLAGGGRGRPRAARRAQDPRREHRPARARRRAGAVQRAPLGPRAVARRAVSTSAARLGWRRFQGSGRRRSASRVGMTGSHVPRPVLPTDWRNCVE